MRILYIDIDTLRADHLGCYGYGRETSPNIDSLASEGVRLDRCYASDTPCLPSRSALISGRFGIHNGAVNHGGTAADPFLEGEPRGFQSTLATTSWTRCMRKVRIPSTTISSFAERHSAHHWYAGFNEAINIGMMGMERADQVTPLALDWLSRNGTRDDWFLHVHMWDPHTPYRTPRDYGDPFADEPLPPWLTEEVRQHHWTLPGPHSAQETIGYTFQKSWADRYERQPLEISSMAAVRAMFDGYDTGVRYADDHVGQILNSLADLGVLDETAIVVSGDHGETLGELGIYCDHQTADEYTARLPMVIRWPGVEGGRVDNGWHYQIDVAATVLDLAGAEVPEIWDGQSFADSLRSGEDGGREHLVVSQAAWTAQRSVRFATPDGGDYICIRTYHDAYHGFPEVMLFDLSVDPHEQDNLAEKQPEVVGLALAKLDAWHADAMRWPGQAVDPLWTAVKEAPFHAKGRLPEYLDRLRATGREAWADRLEARHTLPPARREI